MLSPSDTHACFPSVSSLYHTCSLECANTAVQESADKDATGSLADKEGVSPVVKAIRAIRTAFPSLYVACDLCLCAYTEHGHCGVIKHDEASGPCIDNAASIARLADIAVAYAKAGAHVSAAALGYLC